MASTQVSGDKAAKYVRDRILKGKPAAGYKEVDDLIEIFQQRFKFVEEGSAKQFCVKCAVENNEIVNRTSNEGEPCKNGHEYSEAFKSKCISNCHLPAFYVKMSSKKKAMKYVVRVILSPENPKHDFKKCEYNYAKPNCVCPRSGECNRFHHEAEHCVWYIIDSMRGLYRATIPKTFQTYWESKEDEGEPEEESYAPVKNNSRVKSESSDVLAGVPPPQSMKSQASVESLGSGVHNLSRSESTSSGPSATSGRVDSGFNIRPEPAPSSAPVDDEWMPAISTKKSSKKKGTGVSGGGTNDIESKKRAYREFLYKMMFRFKTNKCNKNHGFNIQEKFDCFDYHDESEKRLDPRMIRDGKKTASPPWAYQPENDFRGCYHPLRFKSEPCEDDLNGSCTRKNCAFRHTDEFKKSEVLPLEFFDEVISYNEFKHHVMNYKVKPCSDRSCRCGAKNKSGFGCNFFHVTEVADYEQEDEVMEVAYDRRYPWRVDLNGEFVSSNAELGTPAYSLDPFVYKSGLCSNTVCTFGTKCNFAHSEAELEAVKEYKERLRVELFDELKKWDAMPGSQSGPTLEANDDAPMEYKNTLSGSIAESLDDEEEYDDEEEFDELEDITHQVTFDPPPSLNGQSVLFDNSKFNGQSLLGEPQINEGHFTLDTDSNFDSVEEGFLRNQPHKFYKLPDMSAYVDLTDLLGSGMDSSRVFGGFAVTTGRRMKFNPVALKLLPASGTDLNKGQVDRIAENDVDVLDQVRHPNVVRFYKHKMNVDLERQFIDAAWSNTDIKPQGSFVCIIMEKFGESMNDVLRACQPPIGFYSSSVFHNLFVMVNDKPYPRDVTMKMITELLAGLDHIHKSQYLHRDLRPSNLLISYNEQGDAVLKICDLGLSRPLDKVHSRMLQSSSTGSLLKCSGTHPFQAMEVVTAVNQDDYSGRYSVKSDIYSAGLCIYFLLTHGGHPLLFDGRMIRNQFTIKLKNWFDVEYFPSEDDAIMLCRNAQRQARANAADDAKIEGRTQLEVDEGFRLNENFMLDGLNHIPEARDLVLKMMGGDCCRRDERLSLTECQRHPFFWSFESKYEFIDMVQNAFESLKRGEVGQFSPNGMTIQRAIDECEGKRYELNPDNDSGELMLRGTWNWKTMFEGDSKWTAFVNRVDRSLDKTQNPNYMDINYPAYSYEPTSIYGLLHMIRNVKSQLSDPHVKDSYLTSDLRSIIGRANLESLMGFVFHRFPALVLLLVENTKLLHSQDSFDYFFSRIQANY